MYVTVYTVFVWPSCPVQMDGNRHFSVTRPVIGFAEDAFLHDQSRGNYWHTFLKLYRPQPFYGPFSGPTGWAGARRELLDFIVQGKINRGRHTDYPDGRHSIRTKQCPPPPSPIFCTGWMPFLPPNQQCQSTEGKLRIRIREKTPEFSSTVLPAPSPYHKLYRLTD